MRILTFVRYALTGGFATATHYAILLVLVESGGVPAPTATALGALGGALVAYFAAQRGTLWRLRTVFRNSLEADYALSPKLALHHSPIIR